MECAFEASGDGAEYAYRASSPTSDHLPRSGYAVRQTSTAVQWGTLDSAGKFTVKASGPAVPFGTRLRILVHGDRHQVVLADGTVVISEQRDGSYNGIRGLFGYNPGSAGGTIRGYQIPLPD
jgi:hypothetical protein